MDLYEVVSGSIDFPTAAWHSKDGDSLETLHKNPLLDTSVDEHGNKLKNGPNKHETFNALNSGCIAMRTKQISPRPITSTTEKNAI